MVADANDDAALFPLARYVILNLHRMNDRNGTQWMRFLAVVLFYLLPFVADRTVESVHLETDDTAECRTSMVHVANSEGPSGNFNNYGRC